MFNIDRSGLGDEEQTYELPTTFGDPKRAHVTRWQHSEGGPFEGLQSLPVGDMGRAPVVRPMLRWQLCGG